MTEATNRLVIIGGQKVGKKYLYSSAYQSSINVHRLVSESLSVYVSLFALLVFSFLIVSRHLHEQLNYYKARGRE